MQWCFEKFCKRDGNFEDKECNGQPIESNNWSCSLITIWEIAEGLNVSHFMANQHLKQIGRVKNLGQWVPPELTKDKKKKKIISLKCCLLLSFATTVNHFMTGLCLVTKSIYLATTGDNKLSGWTVNKLQSTSQSQICTKKDHGHCLVVCSWPLQLSESWVKPSYLRSMLSNSVKVKVLAAESCPTHCSPVTCSPPGSFLNRILQAKVQQIDVKPWKL